MSLEAIAPTVIIQVIGFVAVLAVLQWRMGAAEKRLEKIEGKLEALNGPRLERLETEMLRSRDRLHHLEGRDTEKAAVSVIEILMDKLETKSYGGPRKNT